MHEVRCENCGKPLGVITDEEVLFMADGKIKKLPLYKSLEPVVFDSPHGHIDGRTQSSSGTTCIRCSETIARDVE